MFNGQEDYAVIEDTDTITMRLYAQKILKFLDVEGNKRRKALAAGAQPSPFYLFAALSALKFLDAGGQRRQHRVPDEPQAVLLDDPADGRGGGERDDVSARAVVFITDNGGETARAASNFPFRGTKGELWEGNTRVLTALSGGVVERLGLLGQTRSQLFSNLDWTPTLLDWAGYLGCIDEADYTWDGVSQLAMLTGDSKVREHLVLNIGDTDTASASDLMT